MNSVAPLLNVLVQSGLLLQDDANILERQLSTDSGRSQAEAQIAAAFQAGLYAQRDRVVEAVRTTEGLLTVAQQNRLWQGENEHLWASVRDTILDVASERAAITGIDAGGEETWKLVNEELIRWTDDYYTNPNADNVGSIPNLNATSRTRVGIKLVDWQNGTLLVEGWQRGLPQLAQSLEPVFGASRSKVIAATEVTRIFTEGIRAAEAKNPFTKQWEWLTAEDELVCPICGPRAGTRVAKNADGFAGSEDTLTVFPPAHPNCRCQIIALTDNAAGGVLSNG